MSKQKRKIGKQKIDREILEKLAHIKKDLKDIEKREDFKLQTAVDLELSVYHIEEILERHTKQTQNNGIEAGRGYSNFQKLEERYG